jgi:pSer/pThr/pTyr-binding forkhead associated (FHA) protein
MLSVYAAGILHQEVEINDLPFSIGRGHGNDLVIEDTAVSRRHALIDFVDGRYIVEDLNSVNGILVNYSGRETAALKSGDVISIGHASIVFHLIRDSGEAASESPTGNQPVVKLEPDPTRNATPLAETQRITEDPVSNVGSALPSRK